MTDADQVSERRAAYAAAPLGPKPPRPAIRAELHTLVLNDLLGPAAGPEEEVDEAHVRERYVVGTLAPRHQVLDPDEDEELAQGGAGEQEDGATEPSSAQAKSMFPSSMGLTFCMDGSASGLSVTVEWGWYRREASATLVTEKLREPKQVWKRTPVAGSKTYRLSVGRLPDWAPNEEQPDVVVRGLMRRRSSDDCWTVTLFLVNGQREAKTHRDSTWLFQPVVSVQGSDGQAAFLRRSLQRRGARLDPLVFEELRSLEMLYRFLPEFAIGHGVSVHADVADGDPTRAVRLMTRVVPEHEVPRVESVTVEDAPALTGLTLDMKELAEAPSPEFARRLAPLVDAYAVWIADQRKRIDDPAAGLSVFQDVAVEALDRCEKARARIAEGIALLGRSTQAADAFRFANRAMWLQRTRSLLSEQVRRGQTVQIDDIDVPVNRRWYPFQLAFILLNLPGLTDLHHPDRSESPDAVADLLWFPTGGGKTEAYLGLTAYTLGVRRLQGTVSGRDGENGVAVLMRYTLRLLTLQQFQRATALICACEMIRRDALARGDARWGRTAFRIGLWVGRDTTPNWTDEAEEAIRRYREHGWGGRKGDPAQLTYCPWCGSTIDPGKHIFADKVHGRTLVWCGDPLGKCPFTNRQSGGDGLPVVVVDEEVYRLLPSLLIATVDKFARLPWKAPTQMLFGQVNARCPRHGFRSPEIEDKDSHQRSGVYAPVRSEPHVPLRPPDLIIQDELHLISGPLGSLVGLYETAIDKLSTWEVDGRLVRPKVIASTATIRNARGQVHKLFARRVSVFPPHGLDAADNFFALQRDPDEQHPGRLYLGVCAPGRRLKAVLIRVYLAYLSAAQYLYEKKGYGTDADPWMTLVGYFNSMRELGGMRRLVDDDIRSRLLRMETRGLAKRRPPELRELTSRMHATQIPQILDQLEVPFDPVLEERRRQARKDKQKFDVPYPLDVLLATNMLSVGVDVKRLGLMVVAGQPKTTSEYIQATSRVGRSHPGIVCTVLNWARPRDLSHYEQFEHYHATFYQYVEALSVTPFASRAMDRGLAALLVSLVRLPGEIYNPNAAAAAVEREHQFVSDAIRTVGSRAHVVESAAARDRAVNELGGRVDLWLHRAKKSIGGSRLGYERKNDGLTVGLMSHPGDGPWDPFTCLDSLRDVEATVDLILDDHGLDIDEPAVVIAAQPEAPLPLGDEPGPDEQPTLEGLLP